MNKKLLMPVALTVLGLAVVILLVVTLRQRNEMRDIVEQMELEKEELQEEYEDLAIQYDGYQNIEIKNDSLQDLLSREQQRVRDLLEELRVTKSTNAKRIAQLKKELDAVRAVMRDYVRQIDSLSATNQRLTAENQEYKAQNEQVIRTNKELKNTNDQLTETVTRAAMLNICAFEFRSLNKRGHKTNLFSQIRKFQFIYSIERNVTCEPGEKMLYVRIMDPMGELLGEQEGKLFELEKSMVPYTTSQPFTYSGEQFDGTVYWELEGDPQTGIYTIDFFVDGNLIGSYPFSLKK